MNRTIGMISKLGDRAIHLCEIAEDGNGHKTGYATIQCQCDKVYAEEGEVRHLGSTDIWRLHNSAGIWVICMDRDNIRLADIFLGLRMLARVDTGTFRLVFEWEDIRSFDATER